MDNFKCESCGKGFETAKQLRGHLAYEALTLKRMKEQAMPVGAEPATVKKVESYDFTKYKRLPPPIVDHLQKTWGNWLNHFEIGHEFKNDLESGSGIYIIVPREYSVEWETVQEPVYDNKTRTQVGVKNIERKDIRWRSMKDLAVVKTWLDGVKEKIITDAFKAGKQLPNIGIRIEGDRRNIEDYKRELMGV